MRMRLPLTPVQVHQAVYVKLRSLEMPEPGADRIAQAAYLETVKMSCEGRAAKRRRKASQPAAIGNSDRTDTRSQEAL